MPFTLSPGVTVVEKDFTSIIPTVSTSAGATAGIFSWGPVLEPLTVTSEDQLVKRFGRPNDNTFKSFFTAANFLAYTNNLIVTRADGTALRNATSLVSGTVTGTDVNPDYDKNLNLPNQLPAIENENTGNRGFRKNHNTTITFSAPQTPGGVTATGAPVFSGGKVMSIPVQTTGSGYTSTPTVTISAPDITGPDAVQATATATLSAGGVSEITMVVPGRGYFNAPVITISAPNTVGGVQAVAGAAVLSSSSLVAINITNPGSGYTSPPTVTITCQDEGTVGTVTKPTVVSLISTTIGVKIKNSEDYLSNFQDYQTSLYGMFAAKYPGALGNGIQIVLVDNAVWTWCLANSSNEIARKVIGNFNAAPGTSTQANGKNIVNDELHVLILDSTDGKWSGTPSGVLEKYEFLSKLKGVTRSDGTNTYFRDAISARSEYVYVISTPVDAQVNDPEATNWDRNVNDVANGTNLRDLKSVVATITLNGGVDQYNMPEGSILDAYLILTDTEKYDVSLVAAGALSSSSANTLIGSLAEVRKDCVVFVSPCDTGATPIIGSGDTVVSKITTYRSALTSSSYAVMDSGWKYQYDRYNDVYRWVPLNGDIAGLCARTDYNADPWYSPGGLSRGQIKNVVRLGFNPKQTERDALYKVAVNPVVTFPGQGTILFGDKTLLAKPSAFDRINVRRLFIVLEKAIATAARFQLFEFNDDFTRAQFRNLIEPFLRDVQGRRGITDFRVRCDSTNNTGEVIDRNEFVASIFVKPNRSINFITLNFVAARTSVSFEEIGG